MLEALLARVRSRDRASAGPNASANASASASANASANGSANGNGNGARAYEDDSSSGPASPLDVPTPMAAFRPSPVPPPPLGAERGSFAPSAPRFSQRPEAPQIFAAKPTAPPTRAPSDASIDQTLVEASTSSRRLPPRPEPSGVRAVEPPPMEVIELDVDPDPSIPPPSVSPVSGSAKSEEGLESRSRLVSAPPVALGSGDRGDDDLGDDDVGDDDGAELLDDDEDEEPFALSVPPGHAASDPTIEAVPAEVSQAEMDAIEEADRAPTSSRRPISMEEKMSELEEDSPPLHSPPPASGKLPAASPALELEPLDSQPMPIAAPVAVASPRLTREALRADPLPQTEVAVFVGRTPSDLAAKTFGDLLDATLAL